MFKNYSIRYTQHAQADVLRIRQYIYNEFKYIELVDRFDKKISKALKKIKNAPNIYKTIEFTFKGYNIYVRCVDSYLFFYIVEDVTIVLLRVLQDRMNWKYIIELWIKENS